MVKSKKYQDNSKYQNASIMEKFNCNRVIKIAVNKSNNMVNLFVNHDFLHNQIIIN
jgi:hypothetical protein